MLRVSVFLAAVLFLGWQSQLIKASEWTTSENCTTISYNCTNKILPNCTCVNQTAACLGLDACADKNRTCKEIGCNNCTWYNVTTCLKIQTNACGQKGVFCGTGVQVERTYGSECAAACDNGVPDGLPLYNSTTCDGNCYDGRKTSMYRCKTSGCTLKVVESCYLWPTCLGGITTIPGTCSSSCAGGLKNVTRKCLHGGSPSYNCAGFGGNNTEKVDTEMCNPQDCPSWASWTTSGACSKTCGAGIQSYTRQCLYQGLNDISLCQGSPNKDESCNTQDCPTWHSWAPSGSCSRTCGAGFQIYTRMCEYQGSTQSNKCPGSSVKTEPCENNPCPSLWATWTAWSNCNATVQERIGVNKRHRNCKSGLVVGKCQGKTESDISIEYDYRVCTWCQIQLELCSTAPPCDHWSSWATDHCGSNIGTLRRYCVGVWKPSLVNPYCESHDAIKPSEAFGSASNSGCSVAGPVLGILGIVALFVALIFVARWKGYITIEINKKNGKPLKKQNAPKKVFYSTKPSNRNEYELNNHINNKFESDDFSSDGQSDHQNCSEAATVKPDYINVCQVSQQPQMHREDENGYVMPNLLLSDQHYEDAEIKPVSILTNFSAGADGMVTYDQVQPGPIKNTADKVTKSVTKTGTVANKQTPQKKTYVNIPSTTSEENHLKANSNASQKQQNKPKPLTPKPLSHKQPNQQASNKDVDNSTLIPEQPNANAKVQALAKKLQLATEARKQESPYETYTTDNIASKEPQNGSVDATRAKLAEMFKGGATQSPGANQNTKPDLSKTGLNGQKKKAALIPPNKKF